MLSKQGHVNILLWYVQIKEKKETILELKKNLDSRNNREVNE